MTIATAHDGFSTQISMDYSDWKPTGIYKSLYISDGLQSQLWQMAICSGGIDLSAFGVPEGDAIEAIKIVYSSGPCFGVGTIQSPDIHRRASVHMTPHRTGGKFGQVVEDWAKTGGADSSYVILTNNDYEEDPTEESKDHDNDTALIPTPGGEPADDDLAQLTLNRLSPGTNNGTVTITVSDPSAVRLFTSDGTELTDFSVDLANPSGYFAGLLTGDVDVWMEGLHADSDLVFTMALQDRSGNQVARDVVHVCIAEWKFVGSDGNATTDGVANIPKQTLLDAAAGVNDAEIQSEEKYKTEIEGLDPNDVQQMTVTSDDDPTDSFIDQIDTSGSSTESAYFALLYSSADGSLLTSAQRSQILASLGVNAVHNQAATTTVATKGGDVQARPQKLSARRTLVRALRDELHKHSPYDYYHLLGYDGLFRDEISVAQSELVLKKVSLYPHKGIPDHPDAPAVTEPTGTASSVMSITPDMTSVDAVHESVHVLQNRSHFPGKGQGPDEAEAWIAAQLGLRYSMLFLGGIEQAIKVHDQVAVERLWTSAWSRAIGFPSMVGVTVVPPSDNNPLGYDIHLTDFANVSTDLGIKFSASALAAHYNGLLTRAGMVADLNVPAGLDPAFW